MNATWRSSPRCGQSRPLSATQWLVATCTESSAATSCQLNDLQSIYSETTWIYSIYRLRFPNIRKSTLAWQCCRASWSLPSLAWPSTCHVLVVVDYLEVTCHHRQKITSYTPPVQRLAKSLQQSLWLKESETYLISKFRHKQHWDGRTSRIHEARGVQRINSTCSVYTEYLHNGLAASIDWLITSDKRM